MMYETSNYNLNNAYAIMIQLLSYYNHEWEVASRAPGRSMAFEVTDAENDRIVANLNARPHRNA